MTPLSTLIFLPKDQTIGVMAMCMHVNANTGHRAAVHPGQIRMKKITNMSSGKKDWKYVELVML